MLASAGGAAAVAADIVALTWFAEASLGVVDAYARSEFL